MNEFRRVTRTVFRINKIICKINVPLVNDNSSYGNPVTVYKGLNNSLNLNLDFNPLLILSFSDKKEWSRSNSIILTHRNISHFCKGLRKMIKKFDDDIYYYTSSKKLKLKAIDSSYLVQINNLGENNVVELYPIVVNDKDLIEYEGVRICFNNDTNYADLSYDELVSLEEMVSRIDIFTYSQLLINYAMIVQQKVRVNEYRNNTISNNSQVLNSSVSSKGFKKEGLFDGLIVKE